MNKAPWKYVSRNFRYSTNMRKYFIRSHNPLKQQVVLTFHIRDRFLLMVHNFFWLFIFESNGPIETPGRDTSTALRRWAETSSVCPPCPWNAGMHPRPLWTYPLWNPSLLISVRHTSCYTFHGQNQCILETWCMFIPWIQFDQSICRIGWTFFWQMRPKVNMILRISYSFLSVSLTDIKSCNVQVTNSEPLFQEWIALKETFMSNNLS